LNPSISPEVVKSAREGYLYPMWLVKQALLDHPDIHEAFDAYQDIAGVTPRRCLRCKRVLSLPEAGPRYGGRFIELWPSGEPIRIEPPQVIGSGNQRALESLSRSVYLACLQEVQIRGRSALFEFEEAVLIDVERDELTRLDDQLDLDSAIFRATNDYAWIMSPGSSAVPVEEAFSLMGPHSYAFGHWMWEYLPKYIEATLSHAMPLVPVLIDAGMPTAHREALELILADGAEVIELSQLATARVKSLWYAPTPMHMPLLEKMNERFRWDYLASPPRRFARIIREMNRRVDRHMSTIDHGSDRVFLARRPSLHRKLVNHEDVEAAAEAQGFRILYPEDFEFREQVRVLRNARFVVGPEGSAMFLAFFARPGTQVCILNHPYTIGLAVLTGLLEETGVGVTVFTGPSVNVNEQYPHFADYLIDLRSFSTFLREWTGHAREAVSVDSYDR